MKSINITICTLILAIILVSCESESYKKSRITLDNYTRRLNSLFDDVCSSKEAEGSQSKLTMNAFYSRFKEPIQKFKSDINFETIEDDHRHKRDILIKLANKQTEYLDARRNAILNLVNCNNSYEYYYDGVDQFYEHINNSNKSSYNYDYYIDRARKELVEIEKHGTNFILERINYEASVYNLETISKQIDSLNSTYNKDLHEMDLIDSSKTFHCLYDTLTDWVIKDKRAYSKLTLELPVLN